MAQDCMEEAVFIEHLNRLKIMAGGGTSLEPFVQCFKESSFQADLQTFVAERAQAFAVACPDGSHPLVWTQFHDQYRHMFDSQLESVLERVGINAEDFQEFCGWLREYQVALGEDFEFEGGVRGRDVEPFLDALVSSESYEAFLTVMFTEVQRQQQLSLQAAPAPQEIEVTVPEGIGPGQVIAVEYLGSHYELVVPEGVGPGMAFRAAVTAPA
mmetsp:Transcript_109666/g.244891  ORF Transcript_109666/g.244891 Transcript_109666/m.244891 type:complete len:213 (-) Transcript_109666:10-648(-)